jgi:hypothetical protein
MIQAVAETRVRVSRFDDPRRASSLPQRKSNWREVLEALPATGTRVEVSTGRKVTQIKGTGEFSSIE